MINLVKISSEIANIVGKADDIVIIRRITDAAKAYATRYIRDSIMSNRLIPPGCVCHIGKKVERIEPMSEYYISDKVFCRVTTNTIENAIRLYDDTPFISVASPTGNIVFANAELASVRFELSNKFSTINKYVYVNNRIALYSSNPLLLGFNMVHIDLIPEDPTELVDENGKVSYDNEHYPAPFDLVSIIKREIMKELFPQIKASVEEVDISDDKS